jgi:hypothetical protein
MSDNNTDREALVRVIHAGTMGSGNWHDEFQDSPVLTGIADAILAAGFRRQSDVEQRELHHFETEQILTNIKQYLEGCEQFGDEPDIDDLLAFIGDSV